MRAARAGWCERFHFRLLRVLACECECVFCKIGRHVDTDFGRQRFIYGAIFEYVPLGGSGRHPKAPSCGRFSHARENVREILNPAITNGGTAGSSCLVWLAGHSLGASIAMDMGRDIIMANNKLELPTFLFNPPHVSLTRAINDELPMAKVATTFVIFSSNILKHGLGKILKRHKKDMEEQFKPLSPWKPNLYVHQRDIICKGFINYFEQREGKGMWWWPSVAASGTTLSYWDMCCFVFGMQKVRPHLLPSAMLWVNQSSVGNPHELRQWWQPPGAELVLSRKEYEWSAPA
ncbi:hypothetical protein C2845_PM03G08880 [Panicum miliaceum]|uniref:GDSL esterase/lipase n=1 Tax=Panicum miliaceum TaxID=4540 RepID=A0A3L6T9C4_PANMI|nr:hypothetical protein C2845_PM03G08880 [Panicum miliaceum]